MTKDVECKNVYFYTEMKKVFAFILLLCHMNTSMFLPQIAEVDTYNTKGQLKDDINSLAEYIQVVLGYDHTADDEDDDSGQNFHLVNATNYYYQQEIKILEQQKFTDPVAHSYTGYIFCRLNTPSYEIIAPPPKA